MYNVHCTVLQSSTNIVSDFVNLVIQEVELRIEVAVTKHGVADQAMREWTFERHEQPQHLVVRMPGEHDAPSEELVEGNG